jgi:hypothetical protein
MLKNYLVMGLKGLEAKMNWLAVNRQSKNETLTLALTVGSQSVHLGSYS